MPNYSCCIVSSKFLGGNYHVKMRFLFSHLSIRLYFLIIKIYENSIGQDYQSHGNQGIMLIESILWARTKESSQFKV